MYFAPLKRIVTMEQNKQWLIVFLLISSFVFWQNSVNAQKGEPYLSHYKLPTGISEQNWDFQQDDNGLMYVLNRKGILSFDGVEWENLGVKGRPLAFTFQQKLFYTTDEGVGVIERKNDGTIEPLLLVHSQEGEYYFKIVNTTQGVMAVSPTTVSHITPHNQETIDTLFHEVSKGTFFSDVFQLDSSFYLVKTRALIYRIISPQRVEMLAGAPMGLDFLFSFVHNGKAYFGATNNRLYVFDGEQLLPVALKDQPYIRASVLAGGISIDSTRFALATVNGGSLVINSSDGSTDYTFNYLKGLPDDEVFSVGKDREGGVWIAHAMGITRADINLPIKAFSYFNGLTGSILSTIEHEGQLYVGTNDGLFLLKEKRDYKTLVSTEKFTRPIPREEQQEKEVEKEEEPLQSSQIEEPVEVKRRNFFSRVFGRRGRVAEESVQEDTEEGDMLPQVLRDTVEHVREEVVTRQKVHYQLQSVSHEFQKIKRINAKVRQLLELDGKLYAATNLGLFEIDGDRGRQVVRNRNITFATVVDNPDTPMLIGTDEGAYFLEKQNGQMQLRTILEVENQQIVSLLLLDECTVLLSNEFDVLLASKKEDGRFNVTTLPIEGAEILNPIVRWINGNPMVLTTAGAYLFRWNSLSLEAVPGMRYYDKPFMLFNQDDYTWVHSDSNWIFHTAHGEVHSMGVNLLNLIKNPTYIHCVNDSSLLIVDGYDKLYRINTATPEHPQHKLNAFLHSVTDKHGVLLEKNNIELAYTNNGIRINLSAPSFIRSDMVLFQYKILNLMSNWAQWSGGPIEIPYLPSGKHTILIRAKDALGNTSDIIVLPVNIIPPFWKSTWFILLCGVGVVLLFMGILKIRVQVLKHEKKVLEERVQERTQTIENQNEKLKKQRDNLEVFNIEILSQKEQIEKQRDEIRSQRDYILVQNRAIIESIAYAQNIQSAVMPSEEMMSSLFESYFILFRPRDIVSGDFYWVTERDDRLVAVVADCTGHGVPGAFMSMMGLSFLNEIVNVEGCIEPQNILSKLRTKIVSAFRTHNEEFQADDGMDMAICVFEKGMNRMVYAGAYNPVYIIRNGELTEIKGDSMPVGKHFIMHDFTSHTIDLQKGDAIYLFSDGYTDQFGGEDNRKFMTLPFKHLLSSISHEPMEEQKRILEHTFDKWQGPNDQIDDVLVMGIRV